MTNFTQSNDVQWIDSSESSWTTIFYSTAPNRKVLIDNQYVYLLTDYGIDIRELSSEQQYAFVSAYGSYTCFDQTPTTIFIGTFSGGLKYMNKASISGSLGSPTDISSAVYDYSVGLTSNTIYHVSCGSSYLCCTTANSVSHINLNNGAVSYTTTSGGNEICCQTESGPFYYTTHNRTKIHRVDDHRFDWTEPFVTYELYGNTINAACFGDGHLYLATVSGIFVCDSDAIVKCYVK